MPSDQSTTKNPARVVAGLKSTLARDNVSDEAKAHAQERLENMGAATTDDTGESKATLTNDATSSDEYLEDTDTAGDEHNDEHQTRVLAGYKAALHNPRVSEEAKQHASEYLEEHA